MFVFVDESKIAPKPLGRRRVVGAKNTERVTVVENPNERGFNMLLLTNLSVVHDPLFVRLRAESVDADVFYEFIETAFEAGYIREGQIIVWDNARIHSAQIIQPRLLALFGDRVLIQPLPTYSPEYNPCEYVFAQVKSYARYR